MKRFIQCRECFLDWKLPMTFQDVEIRDDNTYKLTCPNGHETVTNFPELKFSVLFSIAANAMLDGYYREAVLSCASSLERFHEFAIRVMLESSLGSSKELFQNCWNEVGKKSERQLGAFIFLWAYCFGEMPDILPRKQVELRNDVAHNGTIPTKEKALEFGNSVREMLRLQQKKLKEKFPDEVKNVTSSYLPDTQSVFLKDEQVATVATSNPANLTNKEEFPKNFEECLSLMTKLRESGLQFEVFNLV